MVFFFFQAEDGIRDRLVPGVQTCALPISLVIFTSDNGPWLSYGSHAGSAGPLREGKGTAWEGGMREPCVMRWPARIKPGQVCSQVASTIDLLPTFASIAGATLDASRPIDGLDVCGLLDDPDSESPHEKTGFYYFRNNKLDAIRLGLMLPGFPGDYHPRYLSTLYSYTRDARPQRSQAAPTPRHGQQFEPSPCLSRSLAGDTARQWTQLGTGLQRWRNNRKLASAS